MGTPTIRRVVFTTIMLSVLGVSLSMIIGIEQPLPSAPDVSDDLMPGSIHARVYWCDHPHNQIAARDCEALYNGQIVTLTLHGNRVVESTWPVQDMVVADFIILWRTPTGIYYSREMSIVRIYWRNTAIWLSAKHLNPNSPVSYVSYGYPPDTTPQPWIGFALPKSAD